MPTAQEQGWDLDQALESRAQALNKVWLEYEKMNFAKHLYNWSNM